jgi:hypothetical protein
VAFLRNRQAPCLKIAKVEAQGGTAAMLMSEKEKRLKQVKISRLLIGRRH